MRTDGVVDRATAEVTQKRREPSKSRCWRQTAADVIDVCAREAPGRGVVALLWQRGNPSRRGGMLGNRTVGRTGTSILKLDTGTRTAQPEAG